MTAKMLFQMIFGVFSLNPKNMRWFNIRRVLVVLIILPFFLTLLLINNVFLLLDYLLFPLFLKQKVEKPVFIISAPRSATTYLFHALGSSEKFTCFKLWEIVFAPSIIQKILFLSLLKVDGWMGKPIRRTVLFLENKLIGKLKEIHLIGLNLPEEDEAVLLWSLSSFYLNFFYPDSHMFDDLVLFDKEVGARRKRRIMKSYQRYVQRHNFVFNRKNTKQYLSKNPLMMSKVAGVAMVFPDALIININRSPASTIPSTQELNRTLYALFTSEKVSDELQLRTHNIIIQWYLMCEKNLQQHFENQYIKVDFRALVTKEEKQIKDLAAFLNIRENVLKEFNQGAKNKHKSSNSYTPLSASELQEVLKKIPFLEQYS